MSILPGATLGILGGGQLGRMLAHAAHQLGYRVVVWSPPGDNPAFAAADRSVEAPWEDAEALAAFSALADVCTYEFENVPVAVAQALSALKPVHPTPELLGWTQDRLAEHALTDRLGIPSAPGRPVRSLADLHAAVAALGMPCRLKTARGGYDGGGQWRVRTPAELDLAARAVAAAPGREFRLEAEIPFRQEVSVIVARSSAGEERVFPVFENVHQHGILHHSRAPAIVPHDVAARAQAHARALADAVGLVGTLTVECFVTEAGEVLVNELAPRVHNSGHLTIEACPTSQFEQHVRAVCGLPLGDVHLRSPAAMVNLLGDAVAEPAVPRGIEPALRTPEVHLHVYGKAAARPGRKLGHVTALGRTVDEASRKALDAAAAITWSHPR